MFVVNLNGSITDFKKTWTLILKGPLMIRVHVFIFNNVRGKNCRTWDLFANTTTSDWHLWFHISHRWVNTTTSGQVNWHSWFHISHRWVNTTKRMPETLLETSVKVPHDSDVFTYIILLSYKSGEKNLVKTPICDISMYILSKLQVFLINFSQDEESGPLGGNLPLDTQSSEVVIVDSWIVTPQTTWIQTIDILGCIGINPTYFATNR